MTRIQTKDLADKNRIPLWEVVPLTSPWTMYIDVTNRCNFQCIYCPTGNPEMLQSRGRIQQDMTWKMYMKILQDMKEFDNKVKIVNLYKDGDPLMHKGFTDMVKMLRHADVTEKIYTKTNGELIPYHRDLAEAPLDMLGISVPHSDPDKIPEVVGKHIDYQKYLDGIKCLYEDSRRQFTINAKMAFYHMDDGDIEKFYRDFEPITDTVAIEGLHGWGAASVKDMFLENWNNTHDGVPFNYKLACPLPFYMMSISSDGITNVCCAEWGNFHHLGDVNKESLKDIFNGVKSNEFRIMHLEGRRFENKACADCQYRDNLPDRIDDHLEEMLEKFK